MLMKRLPIVLLWLATACIGSNEPLFSLSGTWLSLATPGGQSTLVLTDDHGLVGGHDYVYSSSRLVTLPNPDTLAVNGTRTGPSFLLTLTARDGTSSSYSGLVNGNQLSGVLASSTRSDSISFTKQ